MPREKLQDDIQKARILPEEKLAVKLSLASNAVSCLASGIVLPAKDLLILVLQDTPSSTQAIQTG